MSTNESIKPLVVLNESPQYLSAIIEAAKKEYAEPSPKVTHVTVDAEISKWMEMASLKLYPNIRLMLLEWFLHSGPDPRSGSGVVAGGLGDGWKSFWEDFPRRPPYILVTELGTIREAGTQRSAGASSGRIFGVARAPRKWCETFLGPDINCDAFCIFRVSGKAL